MDSRLRLPGSVRYFRFFYGYLGASILPFLTASIFVALLDGIGLTMLLPLLYGLLGTDSSQVEELNWLFRIISGSGLPLNLYSVLGLLVGFFSFKGLAKFATQRFASVLSQRFGNRIRLQLISLLADYSYLQFMRADTGRIQNTVSSEVATLNGAFYNYMRTLQTLFMTAVYLVLAYLANPHFALIVVVGGAVSQLIFGRVYAATARTSRNVTQSMHSLHGYLVESVAAFKYLKATGAIQRYRKRMNESVLEVEAQNHRIGVMNALSNAIREPIVVVIVAAAILVQVRFLNTNLSVILLSLLFFYRALSTLVATQSSYSSFIGGAGSIENVESFVHHLTAEREETGSLPFRSLAHEVRVNDLNFSYGDYNILRDLSFTIRKNETVAIVGKSGSGKTTLANLLCGLLPAPAESIFIDDTDITEFDKFTFRQKVGYVTQEPHVFADSIRNNVSTWNQSDPQELEKVRASLLAAHALDFVSELPDREDTLIGFGGVNLSGGQRQRIAIARELYRRIDLLIFDEATSALDAHSERMVQENIEALKGNMTLVIIAHRLSTIRKADKIIFLQAPGKYETGTFEELRTRSKAFQQMVSLQLI